MAQRLVDIGNKTGTNLFVNTERNYIAEEPKLSTYQQEVGVTASPSSCRPGEPVSINIALLPNTIQQEEAHYLVYNVVNASAVRTCTFLRGPFTHWQEIRLTINKSPDTIDYVAPEQFKEIVSDSYLTEGLLVQERTVLERGEFDTYNGVTVGTSSLQKFYFPLNRLISFAKQHVNGKLYDLKIDLISTTPAASIKDAGLIALSSDTSNAYNSTDISFTDIKYVRQYAIVPPYLAIDAFSVGKLPLRHVHYRTFKVNLRTAGSWRLSASDTINFKLSDVTKRQNIQYLSVVVQPNCAAYNDANAMKEYSGYQHIGWKTRELFGDNRIVDMTDSKLLRQFEMRQYELEYGQGKQLPIAVWNSATNPLSEYFLHLTRINFDYLQQQHGTNEVLRRIDTSTGVTDWEITINANSNTAGATADVVAIVVYAEVFEFDVNTGRMRKLPN